jgi:hypothetical protein
LGERGLFNVRIGISPEDRERLEAQIMADTLIIERAECSVIWHAEARGEVIDFRRDTSPFALLGVAFVTAPAVNGRGSSQGHSFEVVIPGRR